MRLCLLYLIFVFLIMGCEVPEFVPMKYNMGDCVVITDLMIEGKIIEHRYTDYSNHDNKKYNNYSVRYFTNSGGMQIIDLFEEELSNCS